MRLRAVQGGEVTVLAIMVSTPGTGAI
jgi:hypothetical protein